MDDAILKIFADAPVLLFAWLIARWLADRIDRVMALHERMLIRLLDLSEVIEQQTHERK